MVGLGGVSLRGLRGPKKPEAGTQEPKTESEEKQGGRGRMAEGIIDQKWAEPQANEAVSTQPKLQSPAPKPKTPPKPETPKVKPGQSSPIPDDPIGPVIHVEPEPTTPTGVDFPEIRQKP